MAEGSYLENAYALIVGISNYKDERIPKLGFTKEDADAIFKLLINPEKVGLKEDKVRVLLDDKATLRNIKSAIGTWLSEKADKDSVVYIFFAGHGGMEKDRYTEDKMATYLLPYDSDYEDLFSSALSDQEFNNYLRAIRSSKLVIFLDSCHAGGVCREARGKARDVMIVEDTYQKLAEGEGEW